MSKEAALRAMREARYSERSAGVAGPKPARVAVRPAPRSAASRAAEALAAEPVASVDASSVEALCGHRSMNGRSCTREQGHEAKNHRYS